MKSLGKIFICIFFILFFCASKTDSIRNTAYKKIGSVTEISVKATLSRNKTKRPIQDNSTIYNNDRITTATGGKILIRLINDSIITIGEKTSVIISTEVHQNGQLSRIALIYGQLKAHVTNTGIENSFSVQTASATCGVRGTVFTIASGNAAGSFTSVHRGTIALKTASGETLVSQGHSIEAFDNASVKKTAKIGNPNLWITRKNRETQKNAGAILSDMKNRIRKIDRKTFLTAHNPFLEYFFKYYSNIAELFKIIPAVDFIRRKFELGVLKTAAKIIYPIKEKIFYIKILAGKLKALIAAFEGPNRNRARTLSKKIERIFSRFNRIITILDRTEVFYRIRMMHYRK